MYDKVKLEWWAEIMLLVCMGAVAYLTLSNIEGKNIIIISVLFVVMLGLIIKLIIDRIQRYLFWIKLENYSREKKLRENLEQNNDDPEHEGENGTIEYGFGEQHKSVYLQDIVCIFYEKPYTTLIFKDGTKDSYDGEISELNNELKEFIEISDKILINFAYITKRNRGGYYVGNVSFKTSAKYKKIADRQYDAFIKRKNESAETKNIM